MYLLQFTIAVGLLFLHCTSAKSISQNDTNNDNRLSALETSMEFLQSRIQNLTESMTQGTSIHKPVVFFARLSGTRTLNKNSIVMFDEVPTNEGNHFNPRDGIFVAPISGLYQFSWTIFTQSSKQIHTELRVDGVKKACLHISLGSGTIPATRSVVCRAKKGDHVWIMTSSYYGENYFVVPNNDCKSSFMGYFIG